MTKLNHPVILTIKNFNKSALCVKRLSFFLSSLWGVLSLQIRKLPLVHFYFIFKTTEQQPCYANTFPLTRKETEWTP